jgi:hypothetical protein
MSDRVDHGHLAAGRIAMSAQICVHRRRLIPVNLATLGFRLLLELWVLFVEPYLDRFRLLFVGVYDCPCAYPTVRRSQDRPRQKYLYFQTARIILNSSVVILVKGEIYNLYKQLW